MDKYPRSRQPTRTEPPRLGLEGLWVVYVPGGDQVATTDADGRAPMMALSGENLLFVLAFRTAASARRFGEDQGIEDAQQRMVMRQNKEELVRIARAAGAIGALVDYVPATQAYFAATTLD